MILGKSHGIVKAESARRGGAGGGSVVKNMEEKTCDKTPSPPNGNVILGSLYPENF